MRPLINRDIASNFLNVAKVILEDHFTFDKKELDDFASRYIASLSGEHSDLLLHGNQTFKVLMWTDYESRHIFSCNFSGLHLMRTLEKYYHFSFQELMLFEELLSKYIQEVVEIIEPPKKDERTNDRKPFTAL